MPKKFDQEAKDHVVRLVVDLSWPRTFRCNKRARQSRQNWASRGTARQWTQQARRDGLTRKHQPEDLVAEVAKLRRENQELRDTNELLKAASAFFASELDPKRRK